MPERNTTRLIARLVVGQEWFPRGINEVVSHTDQQFVAVNVSYNLRGRPSVVMREFRCADPAACRIELRDWLRGLAAQSEADSPAASAWGDRVATAIVEGLAAV